LIEAVRDVARERFGASPPERVVQVIDQWEQFLSAPNRG
jgi:hypothetical protein